MRSNKLIATIIVVLTMSGSAFLQAKSIFAEDYPGQGKDQLVDALDAAIMRVVDSGKYREIQENDPLAGPLMVTVADCYPNIAEAPFPADPTGMLAEILNTKQIKVGRYVTGGLTGSFDLFADVNAELLQAIVDEMSRGYGLTPYPDPEGIER